MQNLIINSDSITFSKTIYSPVKTMIITTANVYCAVKKMKTLKTFLFKCENVHNSFEHKIIGFHVK